MEKKMSRTISKKLSSRALTIYDLTPKRAQRALFLLYQEDVRRLSEKNFKKEYLKDKHLRGKGHSLDHKLSIKECFDRAVPETIAADIANLEIVPKGINSKKGKKSSITFEELMEIICEREEL